MAKKDGCRVYLSGQGSDEIICDYGFDGKKAKGFLHSTFSGRFPHNLESIFPWENFFGGTQQEFLQKMKMSVARTALKVDILFLI